MAIIYRITNTINGKIYVGKAKLDDPKYFGSGLQIVAAIKKYGKDNFVRDVIEKCDDIDVNSREKYWIAKLNSTDTTIGYNISVGGDGGAHYWASLTEEERKTHSKKKSVALTGKKYGPRSDECRQNQSRNFNRSTEVLEKRAAAKRKEYTCVNHNTNEVFTTKNLREFCSIQSIDFFAMQRHSRERRKPTYENWSCKKGIVQGESQDIITIMNNEMVDNLAKHKSQLKQIDHAGSQNPRAKKITLSHIDGTILEFNGNFVKDCKALTGISYTHLRQLLNNSELIIQGWKNCDNM